VVLHCHHLVTKPRQWLSVASLRERGLITSQPSHFHWVFVGGVIHQVAQAGFPEEPPKNEQAMLIHAEFSDSAGPEKAPFSVFPLL
jgi:hypothetical protein